MLLVFMASAVAVGLGMYLGIAGLFDLLYYRNQRRRADARSWKCQPDRWAPARLRRWELTLGCFNLTLGSLVSGAFAWYAVSSGRTGIYFDLSRHGLVFSLAGAVGYLLFLDFGLYLAHRTLHRPRLFRQIHRFHHRNTTPSAITAMAMHPAEFWLYQSIALVPLFFVPLHYGAVIAVLLYNQYVALMDHSGVRLGSWLPWQAPSLFHDDHHRHFHVNYGQSMDLWDRLLGTCRRQGRRYGVEVFGGQGIPTSDGEGLPPYVDYRALVKGPGR